MDGIVLSGRGYSISGSDISVYWEQSQSFAGIEYLVDIDRCVSGTCALLSENISGTGIFLDTGATVYTDLSYTLSPVWTVSGSYISVEAITEEVFVWQSVPLWVSEVYANPTGSDTGYEWIELYNAGVQSYAMEDMYLSLSNSDGVDAFYWNLDFSDLIFYEVVPEYIQPGEYIIIPLVWFDGLEDAYFWQEFSASNLSNSAGWLELFYQ
ncbi:MAG: hypothetical protein U9Q15_02515 [Patescibacteria group bacterium]|nr:hypothetical protein [Patescibacteria group bacterium]